jgi:hypothetical protein
MSGVITSGFESSSCRAKTMYAISSSVSGTSAVSLDGCTTGLERRGFDTFFMVYSCVVLLVGEKGRGLTRN